MLVCWIDLAVISASPPPPPGVLVGLVAKHVAWYFGYITPSYRSKLGLPVLESKFLMGDLSRSAALGGGVAFAHAGRGVPTYTISTDGENGLHRSNSARRVPSYTLRLRAGARHV